MNRDHKLLTVVALLFALLPFITTRELWNAGWLSLGLIVLIIAAISLMTHRTGAPLLALILVSILSLYAQWGVGHFVVQHDWGLYLLGESRIDSDRVAVAKFLFDQHKLIRAYGPLSHPNAFAGVLTLGLLLVFSIAFSLQRGNSLPLYLYSYLFFLGILFSFSRAAYLAIMLLYFLFFWRHRARDWKAILLPILLTVVVVSPLLVARFTDPDDVAISERMLGYRTAWNLMRTHSFWLKPPGSYVAQLEAYAKNTALHLEPWQIDYVHSVPLLLLVRLSPLIGLITLGLFLWLTWRLYGRHALLLAPLIPLLLLDHYFLTNAVVIPWAAAIYLLIPRLATRWYT